MLLDRIRTELAERLPGLAVQVESSGEPFITISAPSPLLGALEIHDDGDEATVYAGDLTHGHHNPYDPTLSTEARESWIAESVADFVEAAVEDRVLFWATADRRSGGWLRLEYEQVPVTAPGVVMTVWSGPWVPPPTQRRDAG
jgi:hypothetical protein